MGDVGKTILDLNTMGQSAQLRQGMKSKKVNDVVTLGASKRARQAEATQAAYLKQLSDHQQAQLHEMKKRGPAPTMDQRANDKRRRRSLARLRQGKQETIKTSGSGIKPINADAIYKPKAGKKKLGA